MDILSLSAAQLGRAIGKGEVTAPEAVKAVLNQIEKTEDEYNCYITIDKEGALKRAEAVQRNIEAGVLTGPLAGVPMAVKDNLCTEGMRTTCASRILENFVPPYSADAVLNLERAGAVLIGKTNMDEFAMGSTTETSFYGPVRNPRNPQHVPGGSSGGSAAAVAAGECFFALGSDTGGSVRQPASHCGVVGMKPTYGRVSRSGLVAYGSSLDQVGPVCRNVEDCALILEAIASPFSRRDSTFVRWKDKWGSEAGTADREHGPAGQSARGDADYFGPVPEKEGKDAEPGKANPEGKKTLPADTDFAGALKTDITGMRIGLPADYFGPGLEKEVKDAVLAAAKLLAEKGAIVEEFDLGLTEYVVPAYYTIASAEASSNLQRFDGVKYGYRAWEAETLHEMYKKTRALGFGTEVKRRIMLGSFVLSSGSYEAYYLKALGVRALIRAAFDRAFETYDCIMGPTAPAAAPRLGESLTDPMKMYLGDIYTVSANLAGLPAVSIPCGTGAGGLPIGLQLMGDCFQEKKLLRIAYAYERSRMSGERS